MVIFIDENAIITRQKLVNMLFWILSLCTLLILAVSPYQLLISDFVANDVKMEANLHRFGGFTILMDKVHIIDTIAYLNFYKSST
jgi:hypothetical protein